MTTTPRTGITDPIRVDALAIEGVPGQIGVTFCPGKHGTSERGPDWARDLESDVSGIRAWGASAVITLIEDFELDLLKVRGLGQMVVAAGMDWYHLPIKDKHAPDDWFLQQWGSLGGALVARLREGERVVVHCRGGVGRAGTVAAMLAIELGLLPQEAMASVRAVRHRAIESPAQEQFLLQYTRDSWSNVAPAIQVAEAQVR